MRDDRQLGGAWASFQQHAVAAPGRDLAAHVARYWRASWDLRGEPSYRQLIVPYPNVHLSFAADGAALVRGVASRFVHRELAGLGTVFGVAFRPGSFRPFLGRPVASITDASLAAHSVFGGGVPAREMAEASDLDQQVRIVEAFLLANLPPVDPTAERVAGWVDRIAAEPDLDRVDVLADRLGVGIRRLQRLFADHVGVGPKWVIRRCRLHEVTERMAAGGAIDWAALAARLGYADQAHFTRDFTAMVGEPPIRYAARYEPRATPPAPPPITPPSAPSSSAPSPSARQNPRQNG